MITLIAHGNIPFKSHLTAEYFHLFQLGTKRRRTLQICNGKTPSVLLWNMELFTRLCSEKIIMIMIMK